VGEVFSARVLVVSFGVACAVFSRAPSSWACGELACAQIDEVQPPDGSDGVPLNAELRVLFFGSLSPVPEKPACELDLTVMRLLPAMGEPLLLRGESFSQTQASQVWVVAKPEAPLLGNTVYELQLALGAGADICRCDEREWITVSTFTSGAGLDDRKPTFSGVTGFTYGPRVDNSSSCGAMVVIPAVPSFVAAMDDFADPRYNLYVDGRIARRYLASLGSAAQPEIYVDCGSSALTTATRLLPGAQLEVRAVDLAGNESAPNTALDVEASCSDSESKGCAVSPASGAPSDAWFWLLAPWMLLIRRTARRA
jgi:hypothetical protein